MWGVRVPETSSVMMSAFAAPTLSVRAHAAASASPAFDFILPLLRGGHPIHNFRSASAMTVEGQLPIGGCATSIFWTERAPLIYAI